MSEILLVNGPNLNLLGTREPDIYGPTTLAAIEKNVQQRAAGASLEVRCVQSNYEGELIEAIHSQHSNSAGVIINPAALSHTSIGLRDALTGVGTPVVEVHLSNIHAREEFRQHSFISAIAVAVICGAGPQGYEFAVDILSRRYAG